MRAPCWCAAGSTTATRGGWCWPRRSSRSTRPRSPARGRSEMAGRQPGLDRTRRSRAAVGARAEHTRAGFACARPPPGPMTRSPRYGASARRTPVRRRCSCTCCWRTRRWWCARRGCRSRLILRWWRKSRACSGRAVYSLNMRDELDFERPLLELENRIAELRASDDAQAARDEIGRHDERLKRLQHKVYGSLTPWQRAQLARHPKRPHTLDLFRLLLEDFVELHGDRVFGDDKAIVCVVTGEGGSGGALAIGVANRVLMLEHAIYSVISPEGCAAILWGEAAKAPEAASLMRITAPDLLRLGVIDGIVPEPTGGAHRNWEETAENLRGPLRDALWELRSLTAEELCAERYEKFRKIGVFEESA